MGPEVALILISALVGNGQEIKHPSEPASSENGQEIKLQKPVSIFLETECPNTDFCLREFPLAGGHCSPVPKEPIFPPSWCSKKDLLCYDPNGRCQCCKNCIDVECSELPNHHCVQFPNPLYDSQKCKQNMCRPFPGVKTKCLCCPLIETKETTPPSTTSTTQSTPTTPSPAPPPTPSPTPSPTPPPTPPPTPTPTPPVCPNSDCCRATYLEGGNCTLTSTLTKKEKKKWCSKSKHCLTKIGTFDPNCVCCKNCKPSKGRKSCKKNKGKCVDPATVIWEHFNFGCCYYKDPAKCSARKESNCICCKEPNTGHGGQERPHTCKIRVVP